MADSEVKARKKLEEAEKKMKGGGGFLGKFFGGGGSDEAADLFIQEAPTSSSLVESQDEDIDFMTCMEMGCGKAFEDHLSFEEHYQLVHSHQCIVCSKTFPSNFVLELHSDETHCPFFNVRLTRDSADPQYRCLEQECGLKFLTSSERDAHSSSVHKIKHMEVELEKRKMNRRLEKIEKDLTTVSVSSSKSKAPRKIRFGNEQEQTFEGVRAYARPWNKRKPQ